MPPGPAIDRLRAVWVLGELSVAHRLPPGYALAVALKDRAAHVRRAAEDALRSIRQAAEPAEGARPHGCGVTGARRW